MYIEAGIENDFGLWVIKSFLIFLILLMCVYTLYQVDIMVTKVILVFTKQLKLLHGVSHK